MADEFHPTLRIPFDGDFPLTFGFGAVPESAELKEKYASWGLVGHNAFDYGLPEGSAVFASDDGKVIQAGDNGDFGISVTIEHTWGTSLYAHLKETSVVVDQSVKKGEWIGLSGATGNVTGPHLHFGIKPNNPDGASGYLGFVDPTPYFVTEQKKEPSQEPPVVEKVVEKIVEKEVVKEVPVEIIKEVIKEVPVEKVVEKEVVREVKVVDEEEMKKRLARERLETLKLLRDKALTARKDKKADNMMQILKLADNNVVTNGEVQRLLDVSQSAATEYLVQLVREGKLQKEGQSGRSVAYSKVG